MYEHACRQSAVGPAFFFTHYLINCLILEKCNESHLIPSGETHWQVHNYTQLANKDKVDRVVGLLYSYILSDRVSIAVASFTGLQRKEGLLSTACGSVAWDRGQCSSIVYWQQTFSVRWAWPVHIHVGFVCLWLSFFCSLSQSFNTVIVQ